MWSNESALRGYATFTPSTFAPMSSAPRLEVGKTKCRKEKSISLSLLILQTFIILTSLYPSLYYCFGGSIGILIEPPVVLLE